MATQSLDKLDALIAEIVARRIEQAKSTEEFKRMQEAFNADFFNCKNSIIPGLNGKELM